ncbi:MAG: ABC transporter ATP-binding protein [Acidobacteria bacterium]|nr:ABC transporter ATP-binding protein [Acidobacteriota bacterium]
MRRLFGYALGVWNLLLTLVLCVIASSLLELAIPWIIGFLLLDRVIKQHDPNRLPFVVFLLTGAFVGQQIVEFVKNVTQELANQRLVNRVRCDLYEHTLALPVRFFDKGRTGDLLSRVTGDIAALEDFLTTLIQDIGSEVVMLIGSLAFLFKINARLTITLIPTVVALAASVFFFKKRVKKLSSRVRGFIGDLASLAEEAFGGIRIVKAFCAERLEHKSFQAKSLEVLRGQVKAKRLAAVYGSTVELWVFAGTLIVVLLATPKVLGGALTIGGLVAYLSYLNKLYGPVKKLSKINLSMQKILASADRVFEIMNVAPETANGFLRERPVRPAPRFGTPVSEKISGAVQFDRVSFGYEPENLVLKDFDLQVKPGEVVALVGPSGSGKTTVVNLLLRFYKPTSGRILIDGVSLDLFPVGDLRRQIGVVPQETFLFSGSVRDNIALANPAATDEQVIEAACAANAHDFIMQSPKGYLSQVGERGVQLSGGQRQRIAIARALLRDPRIIIFDEATSQMDAESERLIQEALEEVAQGRTAFIIAHRLSTVRRADKIVVIEDGRIVEVGNHDELLGREGVYRKLYALQMSGLDSGRTEDMADA